MTASLQNDLYGKFKRVKEKDEGSDEGGKHKEEEVEKTEISIYKQGRM
jgi:hypothetical protein